MQKQKKNKFGGLFMIHLRPIDMMQSYLYQLAAGA